MTRKHGNTVGLMKAKMKDNLINRYRAILPEEFDDEIRAFLESIEKKEVNLVFVGCDAFEENDNNIWLPNELWEALRIK